MKQGRPSGRRVRVIVFWAGRVFSLGLCLVLGVGAGHAVPERIPRDKVIHPILGPASQAEVLPETKVGPAYPEKWRKLRLGAQVILQVVVDKSGHVTGGSAEHQAATGDG